MTFKYSIDQYLETLKTYDIDTSKDHLKVFRQLVEIIIDLDNALDKADGEKSDIHPDFDKHPGGDDWPCWEITLVQKT